jgi:sulfatase maturation enzyme AslB (radical SAM superfamily)
MRQETYKNQIEKNRRFRDLYKKDFKKRLEFCRDNGCNTVVLTGEGEPLCNQSFLDDFAEWNESISKTFRWIEIQTSGVTLDDEKLRYLRNTVGVSTISLSLSSLNNSMNQEYNGTPESLKIDIPKICADIKKYDFNLRLSLNMTDAFAFDIFEKSKELGANQITIRILYNSGKNTEQDKWIEEHRAKDILINAIQKYIVEKGRELETLSFGATRYSVNGISVVVDNDCMSTEVKKTLRYAVLRPDCKLYSKWDDSGSIIF